MGKWQDAPEVKTPSWESAPAVDSNEPRVIFTQGDLKVFEGPGGNRYAQSPSYATSDPERIAQIMAGANAGELSKQSIDQELIAENPGAARASQFARGSLFGSYVDEVLGATRGPNAQNAMRALSGAMERERPGESLALNVAGGVTEAGLLAAAAPVTAAGLTVKALGQGPRYVRTGRGLLAGGAAGGVAGGVYGAGEGTDAESRVEGAQTGAAFGAGVGGLLGAGAPIVQDAAQNLFGRLRRSDVAQIAGELGISQDAAKVIRNTFDQGGDIQAATANLQRAGSQAMLADSGPAAQALLDASAQSGGGAGRIVRDALSDRMTATNQQLTGRLDDVLGAAVEGPTTALNAISQRTAPARTAAYEAAYTTPINYADDAGRQIEGVLDRIPPRVVIDAVQEANDSMRARGLQNMQIMASIGDNGEVIYREMPNVQQLDEIKKALQAQAYKNTDDFGRLNGTGQRYNTLARELRDAVGGAVPDYRSAVALGGDNIQEQRAFELGRDLLRSRIEVEDVLKELGANPSQAQQEAARSGLRSYIDKTLGDVRSIASDPTAEGIDARQVFKAVADMSSPNAREKIRRLLGPDAAGLLAQVDEAAQSASVQAATARNSATAARLAQKETVEEITSPGIVGQAAQGEVLNTTKALVQAVTGQTSEYTAQRRQQIYQDIARALTEKQGPEARTALAVLDRAMKGQELTEAQTSQLASLIAGVLFTGGATGVSSSLAQ